MGFMSNCLSSIFVFVYLHYNIGIYLRAECESWTIKNWAPKNWCFQNVILEKTLEIPLNSKEIKTVNPKGNQPWIFIGRTDAEAEALILFGHLCKEPTHCKQRSCLMLGKTEGRRRRKQQRMRWLDGITNSMNMSLSKTLGDGKGQGSLACCSPRGHKELDMTEWLNYNNKLPSNHLFKFCI